MGQIRNLKKEATNEELILLIEHKNAVLRCYSFDALVYSKGVDIFPIILKKLIISILWTVLGCYFAFSDNFVVATNFTKVLDYL